MTSLSRNIEASTLLIAEGCPGASLPARMPSVGDCNRLTMKAVVSKNSGITRGESFLRFEGAKTFYRAADGTGASYIKRGEVLLRLLPLGGPTGSAAAGGGARCLQLRLHHLKASSCAGPGACWTRP